MVEDLPHVGLRTRSNLPAFLLPLLAALRFQRPSYDGLTALDTKGWEALLSFGDRAHLTLLLSDLPAGLTPAWVVARIRENLVDNTLRIANIRKTYRLVADALDEENLEHVVIKGFTQYPEFVKDGNVRMQSDIDIFLPCESRLKARDVILRMGYKERELPPHVPVDHMPTLFRETNWQWRGNFYDPEMPLSIELHFCLWNKDAARFDIEGSARFWERRTARNVDGFSFVGLHPDDHVAFLSFHILRGLLRIDWVVHHVYELAFFLHTRAQDQDFWESWRRSHTKQSRSLQAIAFALAKSWFGCEVSQQVDQSVLQLSPAVRHWLLHFSDSPLEWMFTPNHDSVWLHVSLVEALSVKLGIIRRGLLPNRISSLKAANFPGTGTRLAGKQTPWVAIRYTAYVADRLHHFSHVLSRGIWRGGRWWLSQKLLSKSS